MFVRKKKNRSGSTSVVVVDKNEIPVIQCGEHTAQFSIFLTLKYLQNEFLYCIFVALSFIQTLYIQ
jgi:hypothetical protein